MSQMDPRFQRKPSGHKNAINIYDEIAERIKATLVAFGIGLLGAAMVVWPNLFDISGKTYITIKQLIMSYVWGRWIGVILLIVAFMMLGNAWRPIREDGR